MLFILVVDVHQAMIQGANGILNTSRSSKLRQLLLAMQYSDDTTLVANGSVETVATLKIILRLFAKVSGLEINYDKSCFIPINMTNDQTDAIGAILGCKETKFPVTYLGMPLTIVKPGRKLFMPLIEKLDWRLRAWKQKLIFRGGRLQLMRSVLSSIPIYFKTCFLLPKWVIG